jgi:hypothetical protein
LIIQSVLSYGLLRVVVRGLVDVSDEHISIYSAKQSAMEETIRSRRQYYVSVASSVRWFLVAWLFDPEDGSSSSLRTSVKFYWFTCHHIRVEGCARFKRTIQLSLTEFLPKNDPVFVPALLTRPRNVVIFVVREMKGEARRLRYNSALT